MRRLALLLLAGAAAAQARSVQEILADHARALGAAGDVRTLVAVSDEGRTSFRLPGTCRRDAKAGWSEWFGPDGAFFRGGLFERFRPEQATTRGSFYLLKALADPFPLLAYLRDPSPLRANRAGAFEALFTAPDERGVRAVYLLDAKTHLLTHVRFEVEENRPFATAVFSSHREVKGVMLPHLITGRFWNFVEEGPKGRPGLVETTRDELVRGWEINPSLDGVDFVPPGRGGGGGAGFERRVLRTGPDPCDLAARDLDGDGLPDLAVACEGGVSVTFGGSEEAPLFVRLGKGRHRGLVIDDFDGDGRMEILTASRTDPDRTFFFVSFDRARKATVRDLYGAPQFTHSLLTDDLDRDGLPDAVVTGLGSRDLAIRFGNGSLGFRVVATQWPLAGRTGKERGFGVASGDIDGDRMRDIAVADGRRVVIFRGEFNLSFQPRISIPEKPDPKEPWLPVGVAFADLDGDGKDDLLVSRRHPLGDLEADLIVLMNRAAGEGESVFKVTASADMGEHVESIVAGAFDKDPPLDVAAASSYSGDLVLRPGDGKGGLGPAERFASGRGACRVAVADWDRDGRADLLVSNRLDDTVSVFLARREGVPPPPQPPPRATLAEGPVEADFALEGLSEPYEFAGEFRLPAEIQDPSGIACLGSVSTMDQLVVVSDKRSALFRLTLDRETKRLLVGPEIPLIGLERERLDLEAVAWDHETGNLFLGCEADSTIVRADLFGHVLGRVKSGIESDGNDGIEAVAFHRLKDGTPLLYAFRERMGKSGVQPPFAVYGIDEDPFALAPRHRGAKLPAPLLDQTDAVATSDRMLVTSRLTREVLEFRFEDDLLAKEPKRASYLKLSDEILGLRSTKHPLFGNVEGIALDWNNDLFLLVDNNGETLGVAGRNQGAEGRLLWFRCKGTAPPRARPERVRVRRLLVPEAEGAEAKARELLKRAREGEAAERLAEAAGLEEPAWITAVEDRIRPLPGEVNFKALPLALARLCRSLGTGEVGLCEYHREESPDGWYVVWRLE